MKSPTEFLNSEKKHFDRHEVIELLEEYATMVRKSTGIFNGFNEEFITGKSYYDHEGNVYECIFNERVAVYCLVCRKSGKQLLFDEVNFYKNLKQI